MTWISHIKGLFQEPFFFPVKRGSLRSRGPAERGLSGPRGMGTSRMSRAVEFPAAHSLTCHSIIPTKALYSTIPLSCQRFHPYQEKGRRWAKTEKGRGERIPPRPFWTTVSQSVPMTCCLPACRTENAANTRHPGHAVLSRQSSDKTQRQPCGEGTQLLSDDWHVVETASRYLGRNALLSCPIICTTTCCHQGLRPQHPEASPHSHV